MDKHITSLEKKINPVIIARVTNMALYGVEDAEIVEELRSEINGVTVTERWILFVARMARRNGESVSPYLTST